MRPLILLFALAACGEKTPDTGPSCHVDTADAIDTEGYPDNDGDGWTVPDGDCDDWAPGVNPGEQENVYDGLDNDCDPSTPDDDLDGDGLDQAHDCDDGDVEIRGELRWGWDGDRDGWGLDPILGGMVGCFPTDGYATPGDCNDTDDTIHPGANDIPGDGIDQDCSGADG